MGCVCVYTCRPCSYAVGGNVDDSQNLRIIVIMSI